MSLSSIISKDHALLSARRSACDRCRSQKLRCPPRRHTKEPCARCARLGAHCVMSRSYQRSASVCAITTPEQELPRRRELKPKSMTTSTSRKGSAGPHQAAPEPREIATANSVPVTWSTVDPFARNGFADDPLSFLLQEDDAGAFAAIMACGGQEEMKFDASIDDLLYCDQDDPSFFNSSPALSTNHAADTRITTSAGAIYAHNGRDYASAQAPQEDNIHPHPSALDQTESALIPRWDHRLSELCFNLSRRLRQFQNLGTPQKCTNVSYLGTPNSDDSISVNGSPVEELESSCWSPTLFSAVLKDGAEFISVLQSYNYDQDDSENAGGRLSEIILLNILSSYIQIITLYDELLKGLCSRLFEKNPYRSSPVSLACTPASSSLSVNEAQILPGLRVAGLTIMQGDLQARVLLDVMQHQLATIELLLGLPARGVGVMQGPKRKFSEHTQRNGSSGEDEAVGIFGKDPHAKRLLAAMGNGSCAVASLRDRIRELRELVDL